MNFTGYLKRWREYFFAGAPARKTATPKPWLPEAGDRHIFLYDGECGICGRAVALARRIDSRRDFFFQPYQRVSEQTLQNWHLDRNQCERRVYLLEATGRRRGGVFAINAFLFRYRPWRYGVVLLYLLPPLLLLEIVFYATVSRMRRHISRLFGLQTCTLPGEEHDVQP